MIPYAKIITYQLQKLEINNIPVSGVQSVSLDTSYNVSTVRSKYTPFGTSATSLMYQKPDVSVSITKFLSDNVLPVVLDSRILNSYNEIGMPTDILPTGNYAQPIDISVKILDSEGSNSQSGIIGFKIKDAIINSLTYNFSVDGNFEEQMTFSSHIIESGNITEKFKEIEDDSYSFHTGIVKRRKDFYISKIPNELSQILSNGSILTSVNFSIGFSYGQIPSYGAFHSFGDKYIQYPYDITCTFEVVDRGFINKSSSSGFVSNLNEHIVSEVIISDEIEFGITDYMNIYIGSGTYLQGRNRNGGDAGSNSYATYSYTYKQQNSDFNISLL